MNYNSLLLIIILFVLSTHCFGSDSVLVNVGDIKITVDEFKDRFELVPQLGIGSKDDLELKKQNFLYSLIAEKLWALEAQKLGLDSADIWRSTYNTVEKMYVRDALYNIEIKNKINVKPEEIEKGVKRILIKLHLDIVETRDENEIFDLYNILQEGSPFDSLKYYSKIQSVEVGYGQLMGPVEDVLYSLNEGEYSGPVEASAGWAIFYLKKREKLSSEGVHSTIDKVKKILEEKNEDILYNNFMSSIFLDKKITASGFLFQVITNKAVESLKEKINKSDSLQGQAVYLDAGDISKIKTALGSDTLNMPFINLEQDPISVEEFLNYFIFEDFKVDSADHKLISSELNLKVKTVIEQELLAREGYRRKLQNLPEVKNFLNMWRESYLAKIFQSKMADSSKVNDEEVRDYYHKINNLENTGRYELKIIEILTDNLELIELVLNEIKEGKDFKDLASLHTKRDSIKIKKGEFSFFTEAMHGDIGRIAAQMEIGEIYGPIKLPEGYSLFKLVDKREITKDSLGVFEDIKEELKRELAYKKLKVNFLDFTVNLANKYGVKLNESLYDDLQVNDWKLFTYRYIGFGGRITAVPIVFPFYEWFEPWKNSTELP